MRKSNPDRKNYSYIDEKSEKGVGRVFGPTVVYANSSSAVRATQKYFLPSFSSSEHSLQVSRHGTLEPSLAENVSYLLNSQDYVYKQGYDSQQLIFEWCRLGCCFYVLTTDLLLFFENSTGRHAKP